MRSEIRRTKLPVQAPEEWSLQRTMPQTCRAGANPKTSEIALMNPDGSGVTRLHVFGSDPMISPDGSRIVYCSQRDTIYSQIYVMNSDGTAPKRLTDMKNGDACGPAWSRDG